MTQRVSLDRIRWNRERYAEPDGSAPRPGLKSEDGAWDVLRQDGNYLLVFCGQIVLTSKRQGDCRGMAQEIIERGQSIQTISAEKAARVLEVQPADVGKMARRGQVSVESIRREICRRCEAAGKMEPGQHHEQMRESIYALNGAVVIEVIEAMRRRRILQ